MTDFQLEQLDYDRSGDQSHNIKHRNTLTIPNLFQELSYPGKFYSFICIIRFNIFLRNVKFNVKACFNSSIPCSYAISATWPGVIITIWRKEWHAGYDGRRQEARKAAYEMDRRHQEAHWKKKHCTRRYLMHRGGRSGTWSSQIAKSSRPRLND